MALLSPSPNTTQCPTSSPPQRTKDGHQHSLPPLNPGLPALLLRFPRKEEFAPPAVLFSLYCNDSLPCGQASTPSTMAHKGPSIPLHSNVREFALAVPGHPLNPLCGNNDYPPTTERCWDFPGENWACPTRPLSGDLTLTRILAKKKRMSRLPLELCFQGKSII